MASGVVEEERRYQHIGLSGAPIPVLSGASRKVKVLSEEAISGNRYRCSPSSRP